MKKITAIALLLAAALTLPACTAKEDNILVENGGGTPSHTTGENTPEESGENSEDNSEENTDEQPAEIPEDVQNVIDMFEGDSFTTPDGTEVMLTEASSQMGDIALCFDFAYIRYALPVYSDTDIDPELYDFENFEFSENGFAVLEQKPFKVIKGDVLDNGLTVTEANYAVFSYNTEIPAENGVTLEGEWELEGILYRSPEDDYTIEKDEVLFYPNPTGGVVPCTYSPSVAFTNNGVDLHDEFAFVNDGGFYRLGDVHELDADIADWFEDSVYVKAKVTLDGLKIEYSEQFGSRYWSTLKSAERLD